MQRRSRSIGKRAFVAAVGALLLSTAVGADDYTQLTKPCTGLDGPSTQRCMEIIARHMFAPMPKMRRLTLAEKTAMDAILAVDPKAVMVVLADGTVEMGHRGNNRTIDIPCTSSTSCQ
jgi:hypothetical protein